MLTEQEKLKWKRPLSEQEMAYLYAHAKERSQNDRLMSARKHHRAVAEYALSLLRELSDKIKTNF